MTGEPAAAGETILDARGLKCPLPVLKARKAMRGVAPGGRLRVLATDPGAPGDFEHFCGVSGLRLVSVETQPDHTEIVIAAP